MLTGVSRRAKLAIVGLMGSAGGCSAEPVSAPPQSFDQQNPEECNDLDDDGDGQIDENARDAISQVRDADGDGFGMSERHHDGAVRRIACPPVPPGWVTNESDCNDALAAVHPGATETCNGLDDDCDELIDEDIPSCPPLLLGATNTFGPCSALYPDAASQEPIHRSHPWPDRTEWPRIQRHGWLVGERLPTPKGCVTSVAEATQALATKLPQLLNYECPTGQPVAWIEERRSAYVFHLTPNCRSESTRQHETIPVKIRDGATTRGRFVLRCGPFAPAEHSEWKIDAEQWSAVERLDLLHQLAFRELRYGDVVHSVYASDDQGVRACLSGMAKDATIMQHDWTIDADGLVHHEVTEVPTSP